MLTEMSTRCFSLGDQAGVSRLSTRLVIAAEQMILYATITIHYKNTEFTSTATAHGLARPTPSTRFRSDDDQYVTAWYLYERFSGFFL